MEQLYTRETENAIGTGVCYDFSNKVIPREPRRERQTVFSRIPFLHHLIGRMGDRFRAARQPHEMPQWK
jgi:hypothetical protein